MGVRLGGNLRLSKQQLIKIASRTRAELESLVGKQSDMYGFCVYGAVLLWQELKRHKRRPWIVEGMDHWFVHCDGHLIDITATQFGLHKIEVHSIANDIPINPELRCGHWRSYHKSTTLRGAIRRSYGFVSGAGLWPARRWVMLRKREVQNGRNHTN